jgi:hypothetical protein
MGAGSGRVGDLSTGELLSRQLGFASMDAELRSWAQERPAQELSCGAEVTRYARAKLVLESCAAELKIRSDGLGLGLGLLIGPTAWVGGLGLRLGRGLGLGPGPSAWACGLRIGPGPAWACLTVHRPYDCCACWPFSQR